MLFLGIFLISSRNWKKFPKLETVNCALIFHSIILLCKKDKMFGLSVCKYVNLLKAKNTISKNHLCALCLYCIVLYCKFFKGFASWSPTESTEELPVQLDPHLHFIPQFMQNTECFFLYV